jgi:hypothetical protein
MCCPETYKYRNGIGCIPDPMCKEPCPPRQASFLSSAIDDKKRIPKGDTALNKLEKMPVIKAVKKGKFVSRFLPFILDQTILLDKLSQPCKQTFSNRIHAAHVTSV